MPTNMQLNKYVTYVKSYPPKKVSETSKDIDLFVRVCKARCAVFHTHRTFALWICDGEFKGIPTSIALKIQ